MKTLITIILILVCLTLKAPPNNSLVIFESESEKPFEAILNACIEVESKGDRFAYNEREQSAGILQIRPIKLIEFNRQSGKHYSRADMFNSEISKEIFLYFADKSGPYDLDKIIMNWNGSGPMVRDYLKRVKSVL